MTKLTGIPEVDHARHRKIMSPAFNFGVIRDYVPVFNYHAAKVSAAHKRLPLNECLRYPIVLI